MAKKVRIMVVALLVLCIGAATVFALAGKNAPAGQTTMETVTNASVEPVSDRGDIETIDDAKVPLSDEPIDADAEIAVVEEQKDSEAIEAPAAEEVQEAEENTEDAPAEEEDDGPVTMIMPQTRIIKQTGVSITGSAVETE